MDANDDVEQLRLAIRGLRAIRGARLSLTDAAAITQNQRDREAAEARRDALLPRIPRDARYTSTELTEAIAANAKDADTLDSLAALCRTENDRFFQKRCSHLTEGGRELTQYKDRFFRPGAQRHR